MIQRKTQRTSYWREDYVVSEADQEFLYELLAEAQNPQPINELALRIIRRLSQQEEGRIRSELERGLIYDPKDSYSVGDTIVFPALDFRLATVTDVRAGENPEHGEFSVLVAEFEDDGSRRSFAANLHTPHRLNRNGGDVFAADGDLLTAEELFAEVGDAVAAKLLSHLQANPDYFINAGSLWLTTDQMVSINIGHLNIAEAAIEVKGGPITIQELLAQLELDTDSSEAVQVFSVETAMHGDDRFREVGAVGESRWYLARMMPLAALETPDMLRYQPISYDRSLLDVELLQVEWELNDELTDGGLVEDAPPQVPSVVIALTYPHLLSGTLPLPPSVRSLFPQAQGFTAATTLIDGRWGSRFPAWVVPSGRFIAGLSDWYKEHKLPVGARITISRTQDPNELVIDFTPVRAKRDWVRGVRIDDGHLVFQIQRKQIACEYDDHLAIFVDNDEQLTELRRHSGFENLSPQKLVAMIMPELVKLSPQGTVHVKELYSAVNLLRRLPPGPIFAALTRLPDATDTGSGFWSLSL